MLTFKTNCEEQTALHYAAKTDNIDIIVKLIDTYEKVSPQDTGEDFKEAKDYQGFLLKKNRHFSNVLEFGLTTTKIKKEGLRCIWLRNMAKKMQSECCSIDNVAKK